MSTSYRQEVHSSFSRCTIGLSPFGPPTLKIGAHGRGALFMVPSSVTTLSGPSRAGRWWECRFVPGAWKRCWVMPRLNSSIATCVSRSCGEDAARSFVSD